MRKAIWVLAVLVAVSAAAAGALYARNARRAHHAADSALRDFGAGRLLDPYRRQSGPEEWVVAVRTVDADGAASIRDAWLGFRLGAGRRDGRSATGDTDQTPELVLLEAAGAMTRCRLTGGVIPVADVPFDTEVPSATALRALGDLMAARGRALETAGRRAEAERELQLLLSVGDHLTHDCSRVSMALGLALQATALESLREAYLGRGSGWTGQAARAEELRRHAGSRLEGVAQTLPFMEMSLTEAGLRVLRGIAEDPSLESAVRVEAILALNAGHFFDVNRVLLGPRSARRRIVHDLRLDDPVLAEISAKAQRSILDMSFAERRAAVSAGAALE